MPPVFALGAFSALAACTVDSPRKYGVAAVAVLFGAVIPFIYLLALLRKKKVTGIDVPVRLQRTEPYLVCVSIYLVGFLILYLLRASLPVSALMFCYAANTFVVSLINMQWKISAHAMGASGPLTLLAMTFGWKVLPLFSLVPLVAWARVELKVHTRGQVVAGALLGVIMTAAQLQGFYEFAGGR